ncbi:MAG: citrate lyase acyl carrier protein [Lachnospiraceae bacterium]|nr:citrate lyase acyl carrier protein [Lachnospiraceae bacterium]
MGRIIRTAKVGNENQNADCVITIEPGTGGIELDFTSTVEIQYGDAMKEAIYDELSKYGIDDARVTVVDRGAIDPVLRARMEAVIKRGMEG